MKSTYLHVKLRLELAKKSRIFNLWITRSVRNKLLWALRYANLSLRFVNQSAPHESARYQNDNCRRSFSFRDVLIFRGVRGRLSSCGLWMFQIRTMANFETEVYELLKLFSLVQAIMNMTPKRSAIALRLPSEAGPSSRFCRESHEVLPFLTTRLPISWFLVKYHSEMKCFFVQ